MALDGTGAGQSQIGRVTDAGQTLPLSHSLDDAHISVHSGVDSLLPLSVNKACVAADVGVVSL
jgi:hypothetical protein